MTKVFYGNQYVGGRFQAFRHKLKRAIAVMALFFVAFWLVYGGMEVGKRTTPPQIVEAQIMVAVESTSTPPVLQRIINCESGGKQYAKNGQINVHVNADGTVDLGAMQINSVNFAGATKLGLDLTKEADNIAYGKYLFANRGSEPWYSSKSCWNR